MFPALMSTFSVFPLLFTLFSGIQIAIYRNGQKQTKFRSTIDKALEGTYQISTCLLRYLTDKLFSYLPLCSEMI